MATIENLRRRPRRKPNYGQRRLPGRPPFYARPARESRDVGRDAGEVVRQVEGRASLGCIAGRQEDAAKAEAAEKKRKEMEAADAVAKEEAKAKLREEVNSPEVRQHLGFFLSGERCSRRERRAFVKWEKVLDAQPTSLSRLQSMGALEPSLQGLVILSRIGTRRELPQPRWMFPTEASNWSEENQKFLKTTQEMLKRLGPTLVEEGCFHVRSEKRTVESLPKTFDRQKQFHTLIEAAMIFASVMSNSIMEHSEDDVKGVPHRRPTLLTDRRERSLANPRTHEHLGKMRAAIEFAGV